MNERGAGRGGGAAGAGRAGAAGGGAGAGGERQARLDVLEVLRRMYTRGLIVAGDGNVSARLGGGRFLVTPSGLDKGYLAAEDLVVVTADGRVVSGRHAPTAELAMHLALYEERPDVGGIVHAHPPMAIACSVAGVSLSAPLMPEVVGSLGRIHHAGYATPTTAAVPAILRGPARTHDALILDRHGSVTLGRDVFQAYSRLEVVEHTARIALAARSALGRAPEPLPDAEVARIAALAGRRVPVDPGPGPGLAEAAAGGATGEGADPLVEALARAVLERLRGGG